MGPAADLDKRRRAIAWHHSAHAAICDVHQRWAHGTIVKATKYPDYWDYNIVRVEEDPWMSAAELVGVADEALAGFRHRRLNFDNAETAERVRGELEADGWDWLSLLWMLHESPPPAAGPEIEVEFVPYEQAQELRLAWHEEEMPGVDPGDYHQQAREVAMLRNAQVLITRGTDGEPVAFAQLEQDGASAEITQVFVHPDHRGGGRGTAMTRKAIEVANARGDIDELWICADADDRPKDLYERLGFRTAAATAELQKVPKDQPG
jgi:ribosomal protein S18 acetylase RimI-like enzyme